MWSEESDEDKPFCRPDFKRRMRVTDTSSRVGGTWGRRTVDPEGRTVPLLTSLVSGTREVTVGVHGFQSQGTPKM